MSQYDFGNLSSPLSPTVFFDTHMESWRTALHSNHSGASAPSYQVAGTSWLDSTTSPWVWKMYDGTDQISFGLFDTAANTFGSIAATIGANTTQRHTVPAVASDTVALVAATQTFTGKTFDTAGAGNVLQINGTTITAKTGTGSVVLSATPALTGTLSLNNNAAALASFSAVSSGAGFQMAAADSVQFALVLDSYAQNSGVMFRRANNTGASPSAIALNNNIGFIGASGYMATGWSANKAAIVLRAGENWTDSANGTYALVETTPNGSTARAEVARFGGSGEVYFPLLGTTASAANGFLNSGSSPANQLLRSTSSRRYKTDIEPLDDAYSESVYVMQPVWYRSTADADKKEWSWFGLIAEDMDKIEPRLVHYVPRHLGTREEEYEDGVTETQVLDGEEEYWQQVGERITQEKIGVDEDGEPVYVESKEPVLRKAKRDKFKTVLTPIVKTRMVDIYSETEMVPDGIQYERLTVLLLKEVQKLRAELDELKA